LGKIGFNKKSAQFLERGINDEMLRGLLRLNTFKRCRRRDEKTVATSSELRDEEIGEGAMAVALPRRRMGKGVEGVARRTVV
jgi:hypothetical protein